ncbi:pentapeptide repeat-containing protein [Streptomyces niveus]
MVKQRVLLVLGSAAVVLVVVGSVLLVWRGPWWLDGKYLSAADLRSGSAALVTGFRTSVVQLLAVLGAGVALLFTAFNYRLTRRGQVTDRFIKALERLGSDELYVRIGGVLALQQIIQDAPDQATHASQVLNAFVRERAPKRVKAGPVAELSGTALDDRPESDVQQALSALTHADFRRHVDPAQPIDLAGLHLVGVILTKSDMRGAKLHGTNLSHAQLLHVNLNHASLQHADLSHAQLLHVDLNHAELQHADLNHARLRHAKLCRAQLQHADLSHALLGYVDLSDAKLVRVNLSHSGISNSNLNHADLYGADLGDSYLESVDLSSASLQRADLKMAEINSVNLLGVTLVDTNAKGAKITGSAVSHKQEENLAHALVDNSVRVHRLSSPMRSFETVREEMEGFQRRVRRKVARERRTRARRRRR